MLGSIPRGNQSSMGSAGSLLSILVAKSVLAGIAAMAVE
jgi:hypothetical protein